MSIGEKYTCIDNAHQLQDWIYYHPHWDASYLCVISEVLSRFDAIEAIAVGVNDWPLEEDEGVELMTPPPSPIPMDPF
jgi:hypothetical protein